MRGRRRPENSINSDLYNIHRGVVQLSGETGVVVKEHRYGAFGDGNR